MDWTMFLVYIPYVIRINNINPSNSELNPICHLLALLEAHHILHVNRIRFKEAVNIVTSVSHVKACSISTPHFNGCYDLQMLKNGAGVA
jgi:hypothetical protein